MAKFTIALRAFTLASVILLGATGCGSGSGGGSDDVTIPPGETSGIVAGRVADAETGAPIAGVEVKIGTLKATSDANGKYSVPDVPLGAAVVAQFSKPDYAVNYATVAVLSRTTSNADKRLAKVAAKQAITASAGGTVTLTGSTAQVDLPADGFVNAASGAAASGTVSVEMTPINPATMPGNYRAQGEPTPIETFGALQVELRDASGAKLNLAPGKTATIRIPVPTGAASPPLSIPLYYFNESTGLWVREGSAQLAGNAPQQYYQGQVAHFTTWNADIPYETIFINGCVVNQAGQPITAEVTSEGLDYSGYATVYTSVGGKFKVPARRSSQVQVTARNGASQDSVVVATGTTDITLASCLVISQKPPVIVEQPAGLTLAPGALAMLSVTANNADQYTWYRNGVVVDSGYRSTPVFGSNVTAGTYYVVVSNEYGSVTSNSITVTVAQPVNAPVVISQPQDVSVLAGASPSFEVLAGGESLTYQWSRNGVDIPSAQGRKLTLGPVTVADNGALYSVRVTNNAGKSVSRNAVLTVNAEAVVPTIATQPASVAVVVGQSASFTVVPAGTSPFTYQWLRNGSVIADATAASYQSPAMALADSGTKYSVRVTNAKGNVLSNDAVLTVVQDSSVPGLHLPFTTSIDFGNKVGLGAIPANGGVAVPFFAAGSGEFADYLIQGTLNNNIASNVYIHAMLFWKGEQLVRRDLIGGPNGLPAEVRVSSITSANLCSSNTDNGLSGPDLVDVNLSWHVYQKSGPDGNCNTDDDLFQAVRANMSPTQAPLDVLRPSTAIHASNGAMSGWLVRNGQQMQRVNPDFSNPVTLFTLPGDDLEVHENASLENDLIFTSGGKVYLVKLNGPAPAALTPVATLTGDEAVSDVTHANTQDIVVSIASDFSTRVLRVVTSTGTVNAVATVAGATSSETVTPTRVILHGPMGALLSVPLSGGTPQTIYTPGNPALLYISQRNGERLWYDMNGSVLSINSDGSNVQTLAGSSLVGCIMKASGLASSWTDSCDAVLIIQGGVLRSVDAATGATRVTYGATSVTDAATGVSFFSTLTSWGQSGVLTQYVTDPAKPGIRSVVNYLIKTDQPGITRIVMP